jgi:chromosome segregation ATPase
MEDQIQQLEQELKALKKELVVCQKEIAKRNDKQSDYLLQLNEIKYDIMIVEDELEMLKNGGEEPLGETPDVLPNKLGNIELEK